MHGASFGGRSSGTASISCVMLVCYVDMISITLSESVACRHDDVATPMGSPPIMIHIRVILLAALHIHEAYDMVFTY